MSSSSNHKCAVCNRSFGMMLWKHSCDVCHRTVCDDCAPRSTEGTDASGESTKLRVCKSCGTTGRRLGENNNNNNSSSDNGATAGGPRVDPNSEAERERRAAIIEARTKSQQNRGRPQNGPVAKSAAPATPTPPPPPATQEKAVPTPTPSAQPVSDTSSRPTNPALEAALRRQQQQQARTGSAAAAQAANMSPEKIKLLREIDVLLEKHREEPPFGLRASDPTKLRSYLQYLKTKYHVTE